MTGTVAERALVDRVELSANFFIKLASQGVPVGELCRRVGIVSRPGEDVMMTTAQMFTVWRVLGEMTQDAELGLRLGREMRAERYDPLSIVAYSAATFREALEKMARYKRLCGAEDVRVVETSSLVRVEVDWLFAAGADPGLLLDSALASFVEVGVRGTGQNLRPEHIELRRPNDGHQLYEKHFGCTVRYGQTQDSLVFSSWQTRLAMVTRSGVLLGLIEPKLEADLAERLGERWTDRVRVVLKRELGGSRLTLDDVAARLGQSTRTLQRRLTGEGTKFQEVLSDMRLELARQYLKESALSLGQISYLVGFDEPHSFHRVFTAREGVAPGRWRRELANGVT
jgi:AraC-like DNA-binding protein